MKQGDHSQSIPNRPLADYLPVLLVLLISLGVTYAAWHYETTRVNQANQVQFEQASERVSDDIVATMKANGQFLRGGAGLFHASTDVSREEWAVYVDGLSFGTTYPGIQGISYNAVLKGQNARAQFQAEIRQFDDPSFAIRPDSPYEIAAPILYLEPMTPRNRSAIGFDIYSETLRRTAIDRAIATGQISMTERITLVQEEGEANPQAGVLLMLPVYQKGTKPTTAQARLDASKGLVVSVFRMGDLMRSVLERHTNSFSSEIAIYLKDDGDHPARGMLFASHTLPNDALPTPKYTYQKTQEIYGQTWTLNTVSMPEYEIRVAQSSPAIIVGTGIALSLLLAALAWTQVNRIWESEATALAASANERHVQLLLHEVNHRAKNMLAVILAIVRQTNKVNPEKFASTFAERIESLGASHDLLVRNAWQGIMIEELVLSQLAHFATLIGDRITLSGPPVQLHATAAQNIGMAIHELSTNAGKYGALSHDRGEIKITWDVSPNADNIDCLTLSWAETCGPTVSVPTRKGFGSIVLGGMIRSNLNADVKTEFHPQGLVWQMECLLSACSDEPAAS